MPRTIWLLDRAVTKSGDWTISRFATVQISTQQRGLNMTFTRMFPAFAAMFLSAVSLADGPQPKVVENPVAIEEVTGEWHGSKEGVDVVLRQRGKYLVLQQRHSKSSTELIPGKVNIIVSAALVPVENRETGAIDLRLDYKNAQGKGSVMAARIDRLPTGSLSISILPAAVELSSNYRAIERIPLRKQPAAE